MSDIQDAYRLLTPVVGSAIASALFAAALLASGQSSTLTGTMAGQIVMEGFVNLRVSPGARRLLTRAIAITPAFAVIAVAGEAAVDKLLILSQVILSLQLGFAVVPLLIFTGDKRVMGDFVNAPWVKSVGCAVGATIIGVNVWLIVQSV